MTLMEFSKVAHANIFAENVAPRLSAKKSPRKVKKAKMPENPDDEIKRFIDQRVRSLLDMDLIVYFRNNPVAAESAKRVASRLGKDVKEVTRALREFEARGLVRNMATAGAPLYIYAAGDNLRPIINRFVKLVSSREGRFLVYSKLASGGRL